MLYTRNLSLAHRQMMQGLI